MSCAKLPEQTQQHSQFHCENTIHEEGRGGGGGGGGEGGEEMQQTRPRLESSHVNTEYVRKEEEEEEEEKEEERKEERKEGAGGVQEKQEPHTKDVGKKKHAQSQCEKTV